MKPIYTLAVSAALTVWSLTPAQAAPKAKTEAPSTQARCVLGDIHDWSAEVSDAAYRLNSQAMHLQSPEAQFEGLEILRSDLNRIGNNLRALDAERGSLTVWEAKALDEVTPLFRDAAEKTDQAILTFNTERQHLYSTAYVSDTEKVSQDADNAAALIHEHMKLANARAKESKIEQSLGEE